jgi:pimeloyl-ACP methyl ester carboxylesterase/DNA-binding SARP family transcriptional activator
MGNRYEAFGDLAVVDAHGQRHPVTGRQGEVLAVLLAALPESVTSERMIDEVWGDNPPRDPAGALQSVISRLRTLIAGDLETTATGYRLGPVSLDTAEYEEALTGARRAASVDAYEAAAGRWGGDPYPGFDLPSVSVETERLRQLRRREQVERLTLAVELGSFATAADELGQLVESDPYDETTLTLYMRALYRSGRKPAALRAFHEYAKRLAEETGLEPSAQARELEMAILIDHVDVAPAEGRAPEAMPMTISYLELGPGRRTAVGRTGSGPPIVVHPGWMSKLDLVASGLDMRTPTWSALARHRELIIFDRHKTGLSRGPGEPLGFSESVEELKQVIEGTVQPPAPVWAASGAGPLAIRAAAEEPGLISHLILLGTYASGPATFPERIARSMIDLVRASWGIGSDVLAYLLFPSNTSESRDAMARWQREMADPDVATALLREMYSVDVSADLASIEIPCLIIHYQGDKAVPSTGAEHLAQGIPNARYIPLDGVSHYPLPGAESEVVEIVDRFLDRTAN